MTTRKWLDNSDNWATAADWTGGVVPGPSDSVQIQQGAPQVTAAISVAAISDYSQLVFQNAGGSSVTGNVIVGGYLFFDNAAGSGGSTLSAGGTLTIAASGQAALGNSTSSGYDTVSVAALVNRGALSLNAASAGATYLNVQGAAGFGAAAVLSGSVTLSGNSVLRFASGSISRLAYGSTLEINGRLAFLAETSATSSNSALTSLSSIGLYATFGLSMGASVSTTQALFNYGLVNIDANAGEGGSSLYTSSTLDNIGSLHIGNATLSASALVQAAALKNTGSIYLNGAGANKATLNITTGAANLGPITGTISLTGPSLLKVASGQYGSISRDATLVLDGASAFVADATALSSNSALAGLRVNNGTFNLWGGASVTTSGAFANYGAIEIGSTSGQGGGALTVTGLLTNTGDLTLDNESGASNLNVTGVSNSGDIEVGSVFGPAEGYAILSVSGAAGFGGAGTVTGGVYVYQYGSILFNSGAIYDVKGNGYLNLVGGEVDIAGVNGANSALTALRQVEGQFDVQEGSQVATQSAFSNSGWVFVNENGHFSVNSSYANSGKTWIGDGFEDAQGAVLTVQSLRNSGSIQISGDEYSSSSVLESFIVHSAAGTGAVGILTGKVSLMGDSLLQFDSGEIATIEGSLYIESPYAHVADANSTGTNSALTGLHTIKGLLSLDDDAAVTIASSLLVAGGEIDLDPNAGGSSLHVATQLDNEGTIIIGTSTLTAASTIDAGTLINNGELTLEGAGTSQAALIVHAAAGFGQTGILSGEVSLSGDAIVEFASGVISKIRSDSSLTIDGRNAFVTDASDTNSNAALNGLTEIDGLLELDEGALIEPNGALTIARYGELSLDHFGSGGTIVVTGGALDNEGDLELGNGGMTSSNDLVVTRLTNNGSLSLMGGATTVTELYVGAAAGFGPTGEVTGDVTLTDDALLLFASGGLTRIDGSASLALNGANARIAVSGSLASNSALTQLNAIDGSFAIDQGAIVNLASTALTNNGSLTVDLNYGGSQLNLAGRFNNFGTMSLGGSYITQSATLTAATLFNDGEMHLTGDGAAHALLMVSGATTNNGDIYVTSDTQTFASTVSGSGDIYMYSGTTLEFDAAVSATQTLLYGGADTLTLGSATSFAAGIQGFVASDFIDLKGFSATSTLAYAGDASSGILTVTSGTKVAHLNFVGDYALASFGHGTDGGSGLLLSHT